MGFSFAAPYLKVGKIWPLVIVHALIDFMGKLSRGFGVRTEPVSSFEVAVQLIAALLTTSFGIWLLYRMTRQEKVAATTLAHESVK